MSARCDSWSKQEEQPNDSLAGATKQFILIANLHRLCSWSHLEVPGEHAQTSGLFRSLVYSFNDAMMSLPHAQQLRTTTPLRGVWPAESCCRSTRRWTVLCSMSHRGPTTLHYTTLHYTPLHYTTLHYTTFHYTSLHYTTLRSTTLQLQLRLHNYTPLHEITLHYTTLHYTTLHSTTLHYTTLHYTTRQYTEWHCATDRQVDR